MLFAYYFIVNLWISLIDKTQNVDKGNIINSLSIIELKNR